MWVCSSSTKIKLDLQELVVEGTKKNHPNPKPASQKHFCKAQFIVAGFFHHSILWEDDLPAVC